MSAARSAILADAVLIPNPALSEGLMFKRGLFRKLYPSLLGLFAEAIGPC